MRRQPTEWEKIFANHISIKGLIFKIYKERIQLDNNKTPKQPDFSNMQRTQQTHERWSTSLIITEMQSKTTMRYHFIHIRMPILKKTRNNRCWWRCEENCTLIHCWWECKLVQPLWKTVWRFLKKLRIELPHNSAIPLLGIHLKNTRTLIWKDRCTSMSSAVLFTTLEIWKWTHRHREQIGGYQRGRELGVVEMDEEGQVYGDG